MVGAYCIAPIMYSFVDWVIESAIKNGCERLYFLARDGYMMKGIAEIILRERGIKLDLRYLYCSRYSLRSAWYHLDMNESLRYICLGGTLVTFETVMSRAGIAAGKISDIAALVGYPETDKLLSYKELDILRARLTDCREFQDLVRKRAGANYPQAIAYLRQEGLFEPKVMALVDSGWTGSMQKVMARLTGLNNLTGYYFGLYSYPPDAVKSTYYTYYFGPRGNIFRKAHFANSLFECILSSEQGMCVGYEVNNGKLVPVLEMADNSNYDRIVKMYDLIKVYTKNCLAQHPGDATARKKRPEGRKKLRIFARLIRLFMAYPVKEEAEIFGTYVFCDDIIGEGTKVVAPILSLEDLKDNRLTARFINLRKAHKIRESAWLQGSIARRLNKPAKELKHAALYRLALFIRKAFNMGLLFEKRH